MLHFPRRPLHGVALVSLVIALLLVGASACAVPAQPLDPPAAADVAQLVVTPASLTLDVGASARLVVQGFDREGDEVDVADRLAFTIDSEALADVDDDGLVTALAVGDTLVIARVGLVEQEVPIRVVVAGPPLGLAYPSPVLAVAGVALEVLAPTSSGGTILSYQADGLPRGLLIDERSGVISGTATVAQLLGDVIVTGSNASGATSATFEIEVRCNRDSAPAEEDQPDSTFSDNNGDGIDGMACGPVFVSPDGDDDDEGLRESPLLTIGAGLAMAASLQPPRDVYLAAGSYAGPIALASGVSLFGGFAPTTFARSASKVARIAGGRVAVTASALEADVELALLEIVADDSLQAGAPSIGVHAIDSSALLTLVDVVVQAGAGDAGDDGADGDAGSDGVDATGGGGGCEGSAFPTCAACAAPVVGPLVFSPLIDGNGGSGGAPGLGAANGTSGGDGEGGALGGLAGSYDVSGDAFFLTGLAGQSGDDGLGGADGVAGVAGLDGADGVGGGNGEGGGGGGGGAGYDFGCDDFGGAGGAGGAAASGGGFGGAGSRGGGSFGLVVANARVVVINAQIVAGAGGDGGGGGQGGEGGTGGAPGPGGAGFDGSGAGGAGGRGGDGGRGGHGGGGGGGASIAILIDDPLQLTVSASSLLVGQAGTGGASLGNSGAAGIAAQQRTGLLP